MDVFSTELGIRLSFVKTLEFQGELGGLTPPPVCHWVCPLFLALFDICVKVMNVCDNSLDITY
jgi:hypothetical protein